MKILVVGGGGREHAIVWKLSQNVKKPEIHCAPGNGGIASLAACGPIRATDVPAMVEYAKKERFDLVVVAPDDPLALGMVDRLEEAGIRAFGPNAAAARIEASKVFAKDLMKKYGIPTSGYRVFDSPEAALAHLAGCEYPTVVKADGLALGKGVIICRTEEEAKAAVRRIMVERAFGEAGARVIVEDYIEGPEVTVLCFVDGTHMVPMVSSQDHKPVFDGDRGPNTGGMGTFAPTPKYTPEVEDEVTRTILLPTVKAMALEGIPFKGVLYFGLMLTKDGPRVLEYNARFGDPETQAVLPLLKTDLIDIMEATIDGRLDAMQVQWEQGAAVCVVMASGGYPGAYEKGYEITGLDTLGDKDGIIVFHAGTRVEDGRTLTAGGRVLGVTAVARDIAGAREKAYAAVERIRFTGAHYRRDIGHK
ncbi:MAG: phosphoribosylamine--glycine ligase [Clostridiales bacterium]|nr:phosphoribosylamine--glycine ligase [Clostridiales bacterium]